MHRGAMAILVLGAFAAGACGGGQEPEDPTPIEQEDRTADRDSIEAERRAAERARQDSIEEEQRRLALEARERERARRIIAELVHFEYDESNLTTEAEAVLTRKLEVLRANPSVRLRIAGHADERGSVEYNLALGKRRADAVKAYFESFGLDGDRFETVTYGEEQPLDPGHDEEAWAQNRRAEFEIIAGEDALRPPVTQ